MTPPVAADAVAAYLETVHLIHDRKKWAALKAELLTKLADAPDDLAGWLTEHRIVFPGCEAEVVERLHALRTAPPVSVPAPVIAPKPTAPRTPQVIPFRRPAPTADHAQLALL